MVKGKCRLSDVNVTIFYAVSYWLCAECVTHSEKGFVKCSLKIYLRM